MLLSWQLVHPGTLSNDMVIITRYDVICLDLSTFSFDFTVSEQDYTDLRNNIDESLIIKLKEYYHVLPVFSSPMVKISEAKA